MHKWIHALTLMLALSAACPALASTISIPGADNALAPPTLARPYRVDGVLDWTTFNLDANSTVRFGQQQNAGQLLLGDLLIAGVNDATGIKLALENPGAIVFTRLISSGSISLIGNAASLSASGISRIVIGVRTTAGNLCIGCLPQVSQLTDPFFSLSTLQVRPSGDISLQTLGARRLTVPEPATLWLLLMLLPILMLRGRKRTSHGC